MANPDTRPVVVSVLVQVPVHRAWAVFTEPEHIVRWNFASADWCCPRSTNDLRVGGRFSHRMEDIRGEHGFDMEGIYDIVETHQRLGFVFGDRRADVVFTEEGGATRVTETFVPEGEFPRDMQQAGWQAILENFRIRAESV